MLLDEVTYPIMMHPIIEDRARQRDPLINGLFVPRKEFVTPAPFPRPAVLTSVAQQRRALRPSRRFPDRP